jgi:hypothetical protein
LCGLPWDVGITFLKWLCIMQYSQMGSYQNQLGLVEGN